MGITQGGACGAAGGVGQGAGPRRAAGPAGRSGVGAGREHRFNYCRVARQLPEQPITLISRAPAFTPPHAAQ